MNDYYFHYDNSWYNPGAGFVKRLCWYFCNAWFINCGWNPTSALRILLLRLFGAKIGKHVVIHPNVNIKYPWFLEIEDYAWIGENVWIDNLAHVHIGKAACLSQGALLLCGNHDYKKRNFDLIVKGIDIQERVWIGARSVVCQGVTAYPYSMLCVNSVATHDLEAYGIYQGNPAVKIKEREIID